MRKWIIAGCVAVALAAVAAAALINLNSLIQRNRDFLIGQAEQALGRKISLDQIETTLFSGVGMRLTNLWPWSMSNTRMPAPPYLRLLPPPTPGSAA